MNDTNMLNHCLKYFEVTTGTLTALQLCQTTYQRKNDLSAITICWQLNAYATLILFLHSSKPHLIKRSHICGVNPISFSVKRLKFSCSLQVGFKSYGSQCLAYLMPKTLRGLQKQTILFRCRYHHQHHSYLLFLKISIINSYFDYDHKY